jgi:hypothetical protein
MAKKKPKLRMSLNAEFKIAVPRDSIEKLTTEITKGRTYMTISIPINDNIDYGMSIYIDNFNSGDMKISSYDNGLANFVVNGEVMREIDQKSDADLIEALIRMESIKIKCMDVSDNDMNSYYVNVNGNEEEYINIGDCVLAQ